MLAPNPSFAGSRSFSVRIDEMLRTWRICAADANPSDEFLNPAAAAFWNYLNSRTDILPIASALPFRRCTGPFPTMPPDVVARHIQQTFGRTIDEIFDGVGLIPFDALPARQCHRARLPSGENVDLWVWDREQEDEMRSDAELLPQALDLWTESDWTPESIQVALSSYLSVPLDDALALADAMERIEQEGRASDLFWAPPVYRSHTRPGVLSVGTVAAQAPSPDGLSSKLAAAWFHQMLSGRDFPTELRYPGTTSADGRVVLAGYRFAVLPESSRQSIVHYLQATKAAEPDLAIEYLLREMTTRPDPQCEQSLRRAVRQAVPFRDGSRTLADDFAEGLFVQWRLASQHGLRPCPALETFYLGAASLARHVGAADPDAFRHGLESARTRLWLEQLQNLLSFSEFQRQSAISMAAAIELPKRLDDALDALSRNRASERPRSARQPTREFAWIAWALLAASSLLILRRFASPDGTGEAVGAFCFLIFVLLSIRAAGGTNS